MTAKARTIAIIIAVILIAFGLYFSGPSHTANLIVG